MGQGSWCGKGHLDVCGLCSYLTPCWQPWPMLWPEAMMMSVDHADSRDHVNVGGPCPHLKPWWCPGLCCCQGPCLGSWSCDNWGLCWYPWCWYLWPALTTEDHSEYPGLCCNWYQRVVLPPGAILMCTALPALQPKAMLMSKIKAAFQDYGSWILKIEHQNYLELLLILLTAIYPHFCILTNILLSGKTFGFCESDS